MITSRCILLPVLFSVILATSCKPAQKSAGTAAAAAAAQNTPTTNYVAEGYVKATVTLYEVDGCKWIFVLGDGNKLVPNEAPKEGFATDALKVWIKYERLKGAVGTCMAGDIVKIIKIENRE
jgi:hypothetical protein